MSTMTLPDVKSRKLLIQCLGLSFALHAAALSYFYFNPMLLHSPFQSLFGLSAASPSMLDDAEENLDLLQKNHLVDEVFKQIIVLSPHFQQPYDLLELPKGIALAPVQEQASPAVLPDDLNVSFSQPMDAFALSIDTTLPEAQETNVPVIFGSFEAPSPIASQLQIDAPSSIQELSIAHLSIGGEGAYEDLMTLSGFSLSANYETEYTLNLSPQLISLESLTLGKDLHVKTDDTPISARITTDHLHFDKELSRSTLFVPKETATATFKKEFAVSRALGDLEEYRFPAIAMASEWNDDFDVDITFLPNPDGEGYIFSLALNSNYDLSSHSLKQNLYFILDRSSSVQKHRFSVFKRAVLKALASMQRSDTFNIIVVDNKVAKLSTLNLPVSLKNIQAAEDFLDKQEGGGLFDSSDIYATLQKILPSIPNNDEIHTAILLTDGKSGMNTERKQAVIKKWIEANNAKIALYPCAVGNNNDILSLDLLASVSGGKLLYSDTHASLPRKLAKLVMDLKDPIAKDLIITASPQNPNSHIEFYQANSHHTHLYSKQPYIIYGLIDDPCAFDLLVQGRHGEEWIAIKKNVSFIDGHKGDSSLEKEWNAQHANVSYSKFLQEAKHSYLKQAKEILKKYRSEVVIE